MSLLLFPFVRIKYIWKQHIPYYITSPTFLSILGRITPIQSVFSAMGDRALIIGKIHETVRNFLNKRDSSTPTKPLRIIGDTPNSILDHSDFLKSIHTIVQEVQNSISTCLPDAETRWVAVSKFEGRHSFFVLDINNLEYDYESAHMCLAKIPVYVLRLSRTPKIFRYEPQDQKLADKLAEMHNLHGRDPLPLFDDHTRPRVYVSPRDLQP